MQGKTEVKRVKKSVNGSVGYVGKDRSIVTFAVVVAVDRVGRKSIQQCRHLQQRTR